MIEKLIEELLQYSIIHLHLNEEDAIFYRNFLMSEFDVKTPFEGEVDIDEIKAMEVPDALVNKFMTYMI